MKLKNETIEEYLDLESGEIRTKVTSKSYSIKVKSDHFYMTFINNMSGFYKITSLKEVFLLTKLCELADFNKGTFVLASHIREELMESLQIERTYLSTCLTNLCKKGLIAKLSSNYYRIDPKVFWKGDMKERQTILNNGGKINISIEFEKEE